MRKHRFSKYLILLSFMLYAVSPLTYSIRGSGPAGSLPRDSTGISFRNATLLVLDILYSSIAQDTPADEGPSPDRVLIRKNHAVQRGRYDLSPSPAKASVSFHNDAFRRLFFASFFETAGLSQPLVRRTSGHLPSSSGLSPPASS